MRGLLAPTLFGLGLLVLGGSAALSQEGSEGIRADLEALGDSAFADLRTGSEGAQRAAELLASRLEALGARPLPGHDRFLLPFDFETLGSDASATLQLGERRWQGREDVRALPFSEPGSAEGPVVFAGYGLRLPEGSELAYDSYAGLDVAAKVVLVLEGIPSAVEPETRAALRRYADPRYKTVLAREAGARAVLFVTSDDATSGRAESTVASRTVAIPALEIGADVAAALFATTGGTLAEAREELDRGNAEMRGFALPDVEIRLEVDAESQTRGGLDVVGWIPGTGGGEGARVVLGAHYDRSSEYGDNAAGVAALLETARRVVDRPLETGVVLAFWAGHEQGAAGASAFLTEGMLPVEEILGALDFDRVGPVRDNRLIVRGVGSSEAWPSLLERANVPVGFDLVLQPEPWLPADSTPFHAAGIPALSFTADAGEPAEPAIGEIQRVGQLGWLVARRLAQMEERPAFLDYQRPAADAERSSVRAYTGTIPGYTSEVEGLLLEGVMEGGPAEEAGLRAGDVIVEFAGKAITNVYDYTEALDAVKVDEPIRVVYLREGERFETTLVPRARD